MRRSRVVLTGLAVAAAAVTGSAFTAGNTVPASVAGYGEGTVTGATVSNIAYTPWSSDNTYLDQVVFTSDTDITGKTATMTLKSGTTVVGAAYNCTLGSYTSGHQSVTCATSDHPAFADFDTVGLTVVQ